MVCRPGLPACPRAGAGVRLPGTLPCGGVGVVVPPLGDGGGGGHLAVRVSETADHRWIGYAEGHGSSLPVSDPKAASQMLQRYGWMRSQALSHQATANLLEQMRGAL
jgi:hypothetical protein